MPLAELAFVLPALALGVRDPRGSDRDGLLVVEQGAVVGERLVAASLTSIPGYVWQRRG